ncbi:MAG: tetratricopeptide repeat protein, partial [Thermoguttaceae bacterium]
RRLKKDPEDVVAYVELAEHYFQASKYKEAETAYKKALELDAGNADIVGHLLDTQKRQLYAELMLIKAEFEKNKTAALKEKFYAKKTEYDEKNLQLSEHRVKTSPGNAANHFEYGTILYQSGKIKEAITEFQQAKNDVTRKGESLLALGQCFQHIKQYKLAAAHYQEAIENIPDSGENKKKALHLAAKLAFGLKDYSQADNYAHQLAAIDFSYKDVGELLDKIASVRDNLANG